VDYYRCPVEFAAIGASDPLSAKEGYFTFRAATCYGRRSGGPPSAHLNGSVPDVSSAVDSRGEYVRLPFDLAEVVTNLRQERYTRNSNRYAERILAGDVVRSAYYFLRPILPVAIRKHLQKARLNGWEGIAFPRWPVDFTVETLMQRAMALELKRTGVRRIPFVWFWPEGAESAAILTHDVEDTGGRDFCDQLMDLDDSYGIKSSFQIVPEDRYEGSKDLSVSVRSRGFEANVHDLNHDGHLFDSKERFLERVSKINEYGRIFQSQGFRSAIMYRRQDWCEALQFSYDMSVPNVAHLEPQRGGCCTVMPYFLGELLELPLTTIQDYSLFHILVDYSITIWKRQIDQILAQNGLISLLAHPDYLIDNRSQATYRELLSHVSDLRDQNRLWMALPRDVAGWWRNRSRMVIVPDGDSWRIEGPENHRARIAYALLQDDRVVYELDPAS